MTRGMGDNMVSSLLVVSNNCKDVCLVHLELEVISKGEGFQLRLKTDSKFSVPPVGCIFLNVQAWVAKISSQHFLFFFFLMLVF